MCRRSRNRFVSSLLVSHSPRRLGKGKKRIFLFAWWSFLDRLSLTQVDVVLLHVLLLYYDFCASGVSRVRGFLTASKATTTFVASKLTRKNLLLFLPSCFLEDPFGGGAGESSRNRILILTLTVLCLYFRSIAMMTGTISWAVLALMRRRPMEVWL